MNKRNTAVRLVDTKKLPYGQWLDVRRNGVGSSVAAAAVGCTCRNGLAIRQESASGLGRNLFRL